MEWRAEVLGMNADASDVGWGVGTGGTRFYQLGLGRTRVALNKWTATTGYVPLLTDAVSVKLTNVVLSFALTRRQSDAVVTIRVLDRADQDTVLYAKSVVDQAPYLEGDNAVLAVAPKVDLADSVATVTFDNFERRTYEVPQIGIARAVQLTWPVSTGMNYAVEGGPTVQGPWLPISDVATPGLKQMTVPANDAMKFFRLRQAP